MEARVVTEVELKTYGDKISSSHLVLYFKIVGIGTNTLNKCNHNFNEISLKIETQPGFYLIGDDDESLKNAMFNILERFFIKRKENESKN